MPTLREQEGDSDSLKWSRAVGSFYSSEGVLRRLRVDQQALSEMILTGRILALHTAEGALVYPARQFFTNEDGAIAISPAIAPALQFLMGHEEDFADVRGLITEDGIPLIEGWTIAGALLRPDAEGQTLLHTLQQNLDNPEDVSWKRLLDLDGIVSGIRRVLPKPQI